MIQNYTGNNLPLVSVLRHSADASAADNILANLEGHGFRLCILDENSRSEKIIKKSCAVIAVISESFNSSERLADALITADGTDREIIPANIDDSKPDESISRTFRARNSVFRSRYASDEEFANRLLTADSLKNPFVTNEQKRAAKILAGGAIAAVVAVIVAVVLGVSSAAKNTTVTLNNDNIEEANEFAKYTKIALVGDKLIEAETIWDVCAEDWDGNRRIYRLLEDGSEVTPATNSDLSFLQYMTNLRSLVLIEQTATELPDLSAVKNLSSVEIWNCELADLSAFKDCRNLTFMHLTARISDLSQANDIPNLYALDIIDDYDGGCLKSLEGFAPKQLKSLQLISENITDISGLENCSGLTKLEINTPILRDFSTIGELKNIEELIIDHCDRCTDLSCLSSCDKLKSIHLQDLWNLNGDLSCLSSCSRLENIELFCRLNSLDFLKGINHKNRISLGFCDGELTDFDGLAEIKEFNHLHVNLNGRSYSLVLPYLKNATVRDFELYECSGADLKELPKVLNHLKITGGNLTSLEGLQSDLSRLTLDNMPRLTTLSGIEGTMVHELNVNGCPRLKDWDPLYERHFTDIELNGVYSMPDFSKISFAERISLRLVGIPDLNNLDFLDGIDSNIIFNGLTLVGLDELNNLNALYNRKGEGLEVSPALEDQAAALVESGNFREYTVNYENLDWLNDRDFTLISLDEIDELPDALLARVTNLCLVGDILVDENGGEYWERRDNHDISYFVKIDPDGIETIARTGTLQSFDRLQKLTGLKRLRLFDQPIRSLEGLQNCTELECVEISVAPELEDISPVFALPSVKELYLSEVPFRSLEGIQNLRHLENLSICWCRELEDLAPLGEIAGRLANLNLDGYPVADWIDYLADSGMQKIELHHCVNSREELELLCEKMPDLRELDLRWTEELEDLTPLLSMKNLKYVQISSGMPKAASSLEGEELPFTFEIND